MSEICPKPQMEVAVGYETVDAPKKTDAVDPNGAVAGWIELVNAGEEDVDLSDYRLGVFNRGKELKAKKFAALPSRTVGPGQRVVIYTTKDYCEGGRFSTALMDEDAAKAFSAGEAPGIGSDVLVLGTKVNPKKFPLVRLMKGDAVIDTVIVPCDLPDDCSVVAMDPEEDGATLRYLSVKPTKGAANDLTGAVRLGPNAGPLYGVAHDFSDLDPVPPAKAGQAYAVTLDVNPVFGGNEKDEIASVTLVYRTDVNVTDEAQFKTLTMAKDGDPDATGHGQAWTAAVPAANLPTKGMLLQWRAKITDAAGNTWTSPAFLDKANGYGWYGTIVDPGVGDGDGQLSATLPTLHLFAETGANNKSGTTTYYLADRPGKSSSTGTYGDNCLMNLDYDETYECLNTTAQNTTKKQNFRKFYPYGARVAIYDSQTSNYYDNVRIDCRGNSSDDYYKRSHGLKFSKIKAYRLAKTYVHPVSGEEIDEVAKTSFCAEYNDPAMFRQRLAFWFMNAAGVPAPWEDPKRINLNGKFYQFAYESPRFGEELLCDIYGFDELGYGYKNVGTFHQVKQFTDDWGFTMGTSGSAGTKRYTPDDGKEKGFDELLALFSEISAAENVRESASNPSDTTGLDNAALTAKVAEKFDLPAWINYLAATKITQEGDDAWGNVGAYWDNAKLLDGKVRGTGTWRPIAWDMNCSWGQYYQCHVSVGRNGIMADQDWNKCHPLYGGVRIWGYKSSSASSSNSYYKQDGANYAFEAVFQSTKFRRLFLRRLRTLMDAYLKEQDTLEADTPIAVQAKAYAEEIQAEAVKDRALWGHLGTTSGNKDCDWVNCWGTTMMSNKGIQPDNPTYGYQDIWQNYIVPRRVHLYTTHSIDNTSKGVGYALAKSAGIPHAQSAIADLKDGFTAEYDENLGAVIIRNANAEAIDLSGWELAGPVAMTLPSGTVIDQGTEAMPGELYVTADRRATIAKMTVTDQVVVGNGTAGGPGGAFQLTATDEARTVIKFGPSINTFLPTGNGESWDEDANWSDGRFPNAAGASAAIGVPTKGHKKNGWRNIHINSNDVTVGIVEVTNGGWTNRIDTGTSGDLILDGGTDESGTAVSATFTVMDEEGAGLTIIDLDAPNAVRLDSDTTFTVGNTEGDANFGGLLVKGILEGNGHDLKKAGAGRMTLDCTGAVAEAATVRGGAVAEAATVRLQVEGGVLAVLGPMEVAEITKSGELWVKTGSTELEEAVAAALVSAGKCNPNISIFVPSEYGDATWYGGVVATKFGGTPTAYVPSASGEVTFDGRRWTVCAAAEIDTVETASGAKTLRVKVPYFGPAIRVGGTDYATLAEAVAAANSQNPMVFAMEPTVDNEAHTVAIADGTPVPVADHYDLALADDRRTVTLTLNAKAQPVIVLATRITHSAGESVGTQFKGFLTKKGLWYAWGKGGEPATDWVAGDDTPMELEKLKPEGDGWELMVRE